MLKGLFGETTSQPEKVARPVIMIVQLFVENPLSSTVGFISFGFVHLVNPNGGHAFPAYARNRGSTWPPVSISRTLGLTKRRLKHLA